jgi:hypothetical protein
LANADKPDFEIAEFLHGAGKVRITNDEPGPAKARRSVRWMRGLGNADTYTNRW